MSSTDVRSEVRNCAVRTNVLEWVQRSCETDASVGMFLDRHSDRLVMPAGYQ